MIIDFSLKENNKMPKIVEYHKNNSLIFAIFNKLPTPTQRKIWDVLLYMGKQNLFLLKKKNPEKYLELKNNNFKNFFLPIAIELKYLMSLLNIESKNKQIQLIKNISLLEEIYIEKINILKEGKEIEINFNAEEIKKLESNDNDYDFLLEKFWKIKNKISKYSKHRLIIEPEIDFEDETFICFLSPNIVKYIESNDNYTVINILVHTFLNSTYAINLYDILVSKFKAQKEMMEKGKIPKTDLIQTEYIELDKLQDMLGVDKNLVARMQFKIFNRDILKPSVKEINESNVTEFEIVDILRKTHKRKVTALSFVLKPKETFDIPALFNEQIILTNQEELIKLKSMLKNKENKEKTQDAQDTQKIQKSPLEELKEKLKTEQIKSLREFSNELQKLKNIDITNILPNAKGKILRINEFGMLELDGEEVDNIKANSIRRTLYQYPDLLGKFEEIDNELEELKDKFINKVWVFMQNGFYCAVGVKNIIRENQNTVKVIGEELLREIKNFEIKVAIDFLKTQSPKNKLSLTDKDEYIKYNSLKELEQLEDFFKANKDKFQEWLDYLEKESLKVNEKFLSLKEDTSEYKETAKRLEFLDRYYSIAYDLLQNEKVNQTDKMQVLKKFKEWVSQNN